MASLVVMAATGLLIGWRVHSAPQDVLAGFLVLLLLLSWVMGWVALVIRTPESYSQRHGRVPAGLSRQHLH